VGQYGPPDPPGSYAAPGQYGPPDAYAQPDAPAQPDAYHRPRAYGQADAYDQADAYREQDAYDQPGAYGPPDPYAAPGAYGPGDRYAGPGPGAETHPSLPPEAYGQPGYPAPDPFEPQPGSQDWDPGPEHDWDAGQEPRGFTSLRRGQEDTGTGPRTQPPPGPRTQPPPGPRPAGRQGRQPQASQPRQQQAGQPRQWDDAPSREGLIPGFWDTPGSRSGRPGRPRRRVGRVLAPLLAVALLCVLAAGGYDLYQRFQSKDFTGPGFGHVTVQVLRGDSATSLAPRLVKLGVVASSSSFISAAKHSSNPQGLEPGFFSLHKHMNSALAYKMLLNPASRIQAVVTIPEGLRMSQILTALEKKSAGTLPASAFTAAAKDTAALGLPAYANGHAEGYLFPATYNFNPGTSALGMLQAMVARFKQEAASIDLPAAAKAAHLTPGQVITVASLLQAEAGNPKYYRQVAEVIYNRLNIGMMLQLQSTVNYALHKSEIHLTVSQLNVNSPYNTYVHAGLPPGPIGAPGDAAIEAALHPGHGNLLYFVTVNLKTGLTKFTSSNAQFQQFVVECKKNNAC